MLPETLVFGGDEGPGHEWRNFTLGELHQPLALGVGGEAQDAALPVQHQGAGDRLQGRGLKAGGCFQIEGAAGQAKA